MALSDSLPQINRGVQVGYYLAGKRQKSLTDEKAVSLAAQQSSPYHHRTLITNQRYPLIVSDDTSNHDAMLSHGGINVSLKISDTMSSVHLFTETNIRQREA
ncbi:hypothetical protein TNCV_1478571 [Trichonephila clavipes]|nr:hypothetical protein TNCV_1478571 [Trichonephila clavipes]